MRILFYLPVVTPWWFQSIIVPLIAKLASAHEVHVLAPVPWKGTGLGADEIEHCAHLPDIHWHIVNDESHTSMRTDATARKAIIDFVQSIAPDYVFCRSADLETVQSFPGKLRHITEGVADPLPLAKGSIHFTQAPFDHGLLPELNQGEVDKLHRMIEPYWPAIVHSAQLEDAQRQYFREWADLPEGRKIIVLPLEYEHEENFFTIHRIGKTPNARLVEEVLNQIDDRFCLVLANHPLNELHVDNSALEAVVAANPKKARLLRCENPIDRHTTRHILREADGVMLGDSKVFSIAGFFGTPVLRRTRFKSGDWLNAYDDMASFLEAVAGGTAKAPDQDAAKTWFAFHVANNLFSAAAAEIDGEDLLDRFDNPVNPARWERNFAHFVRDWRVSVPA